MSEGENKGDGKGNATIGPPPGFVRPKPGRTKPKGEEKQSSSPTKAEQPQPQPESPTPNQKKRGRKPGSFTRNKKHLAARLKKEHDAREAYRLRYIEGKTLKEIAEVLNRKSQGQLHTLIEEEKRRLRGELVSDAKFVGLEFRILYGKAADNYSLTSDPEHFNCAFRALREIAEMVGAYPDKKDGSSNNTSIFIGAGNDLSVAIQQARNDPEFIEFHRQRAIDCDSEPSPICEDSEPRPMADGAASAGIGSGFD